MVKNCKTCANEGKADNEEPCMTCVTDDGECSKWKPKICANCGFSGVPVNGECEVCEDGENHVPTRWKPIEAAQKAAPEAIDHPAHYADTCSLECIDAMRIAFGDGDVAMFCIINAYKYIWRWKYKNGIEDLKKAEWYLDKAAELVDYDTEQCGIMKDLIQKEMKKETEKNESE